MKIDGVEVNEGARVLFRQRPTRWTRIKNWFRRKLRLKEKHQENGIYEVQSGPWGD